MMTSTAMVALRDEERGAGQWTQGQVALLKEQIAPGTTDEELALFGEVCKRTGLDPFTRQIYAIKRSDGAGKRMTIQTGIDGYRLIAARSGLLAGIDDALFDTEQGEHPTWARVTVYRMVGGQRCPFTATARWGEYAVLDSGGQPSRMWKRMAWLMLGKCAEALALRKAFPAELSGIYTPEEMEQSEPGAVTPVVAMTMASAHRPKGPVAKAAPRGGNAPLLNPPSIDIEIADMAKQLGFAAEVVREWRQRHDVPMTPEGKATTLTGLKSPAQQDEMAVIEWAKRHHLAMDQVDAFVAREKLTFTALMAALAQGEEAEADIMTGVRA